MWPVDLPPPIPIAAPAPERPPSSGSWFEVGIVANNSGLRETAEKKAFEQAAEEFQGALSDLPSDHKAAIARIHEESTMAVNQRREQGVKADQLATFVGKVMTYSHERLLQIEQHDPQLQNLKPEYDALSRVFYDGDQVLNTYLAWVRTDD